MATVEERALAAAARGWGLILGMGILLVIFGFLVFSLDVDQLWVLSVLFGVAFIFSGIGQLVTAAVTEYMRWVWIVGGTLAIIAGIIALAYPSETLVVLALLLGWYLLVVGIADIVVSLTNTDVSGWWIQLFRGIVALALGAWAIGEPDRSIVLLATIVGIYAILRGIVDIILAFSLRGIKKDMEIRFS